jgi:PmbA protein
VSDLDDIAQKVLGWTNDDESVEVYVSRGADTEIVVYGGEIESLSRAESFGAGIRVIKDGRQGFSYAGTLDDDVLRETLTDARDNASFATPDEFNALVEPDGVAPVSLDLWNDSAQNFPTDKKVEMALELERIVRAGDPRIRTLRSAEYGDGSIEYAIASTTGVRASQRRTGCYVSAYAIAGDGDESQTGGGYSVERSPQALDIRKAGADAVERATRLLGATKPNSANLTVVFDNHVTPTLLSVLSSALNGESVLKGRSFFAGREGEAVAVPAITLVDDPTNPDAYAAGVYDGEGLACRRNVLIEDGVLRDFLYDSYAARRAGRTSNGAAVRGGFKGGPSAGARALQLTPGSLDQAGIIANVERGVLVQSVTGVHSGVNPISGDFSVGAEGLLIENGQLGAPIREFTIASTLQRMLLNIAHIGNDLEWLPGTAAGVSLAVADMSLSGN